MSRKGITEIRSFGNSTQKGYMLLAVMLLITVMLIVLATAVPRIAQQIKREKEDELIHRGKEYATAIKKFYHKNGTYPVSLEQLDSTNNQRFLRHRYKDPMTESGEWKLIHVGEAQINLSPAAAPGGAQGPGQVGSVTTNFPGTQAGTTPGLNGSTPMSSGGLNSGGLNSGGLNSGGLSSGGLNSGGLGSGGLNPGGLTGSTPAGNGQLGGGGQMGTLNTQNIGTGLGANAQGGGPIIGVVSTSKDKSIKEFNGNSEYDEWLFVYDPRLEQGPGGGGITVASPRTGSPTNGPVPAGAVPAPPNQPGATGGANPAQTPQPQQGQPTPPPPQTTPQ